MIKRLLNAEKLLCGKDGGEMFFAYYCISIPQMKYLIKNLYFTFNRWSREIILSADLYNYKTFFIQFDNICLMTPKKVINDKKNKPPNHRYHATSKENHLGVEL